MIINNKIAYIHIPRTGGRILCSNLMLNYKTTLYSWNAWVDFSNLSIQKNHQPASMYEDKLTKFTIVRNPYTRFLSTLKELVDQGFKYSVESTLDDLLKFIDDDKNLTNIGSWLLPQNKFIDEGTKIWFFEDGLESMTFHSWLEENVGISLKKKTNKINSKFNPLVINDDLRLSQYFVDMVKDIYAEDFKKFNYTP